MKQSHIMAKDPRFNFYPDNWIGGTKRMTFEQKGAYMELILLNFYCFSDGLPGFTEQEALHAVAPAAASAELWNFLKPKFKTDGKYYWSERMYKEFQKAKTHSEKQSERAKKRWDNAAASPAGDACNGTGYGNGINTDLKGVQGENYPSEVFTTDELFMEHCERQARSYNIDLKKCMDEWDGWYINKFTGWRENYRKDVLKQSDLKKSFETWLLNPKSRGRNTSLPTGTRKLSYQEILNAKK
jgi:uncharacterized protein YdaU (DUF1376 family)